MRIASLILTACGGFLLAVLWMDLMFDVQVLRHRQRGAELPESVLASIAAYYRRVTTDAWPMGRLIGAVMLTAVITLSIQIALSHQPRWLAPASLVLCGGPVLLAIVRVYPNAVRLAARSDAAPRQSALARSICRDHLLCLAGIAGFVALQLAAAAGAGPGR
jgi:hypothetical protein